MVLIRVPYVFLKYSRPNNINPGESKWHARGRDTLWRNFARGKYENRVTAPWEIMRQYGKKFIFASLSSPIGYVRCKPCSWLNLCRAYGRQNKIRYCCSSFNFQLHCTTKRSSLQLLKKTKTTQNLLLFVVRHLMRSRVIMTFAFPMEKFSRQILIANRKPKEKLNYISNGKKYLNNGVNLSWVG